MKVEKVDFVPNYIGVANVGSLKIDKVKMTGYKKRNSYNFKHKRQSIDGASALTIITGLNSSQRRQKAFMERIKAKKNK